jgi:hypothetical protein
MSVNLRTMCFNELCTRNEKHPRAGKPTRGCFTGFKYKAVGPQSDSRLQFDRFDFGDESLVVVGQERTDHVEHGVTEATDVHDIRSFASLNRLVRLQIDVD